MASGRAGNLWRWTLREGLRTLQIPPERLTNQGLPHGLSSQSRPADRFVSASNYPLHEGLIRGYPRAYSGASDPSVNSLQLPIAPCTPVRIRVPPPTH